MLIPELRFPEFRDAGGWEEKPLQGIANIIMGSSPKSETYNDNQNGLPLLQGNADIKNRLSAPRIYTTQVTKECLVDDILLSVRAPVGTVAKSKHHACIGRGIAAIRANKHHSQEYIYQWLLSYESKWQNISQGGTFEAVNSDDIKLLRTESPEPPEQQKIADCLSSIDELITAHTQKHDALKAHKKGLMQQLFPAEGETVPKRRFSGFRDAGEWKIKSFDKLFTIGNGKDHKHLPSGDIPVYGSGGYMRSVDEHLYDGESACIGRKGTINSPIFLTGKFWTVDTLFYTHSFKDCLPKFIYLIFQNINWLSHNEAGGVPSLSKANINKIEVAVPKPKEQRKIVDFIYSLDELITSQAKKIESLKAHKKGLMQQLFPSVDEADV